jgi:chaperone modulatory protein CbpM
MISREELLRALRGLDDRELERWIENRWVLPEATEGEPSFAEIDVARARLICDLRELLADEEEGMPVVLSLVDEVYALRRRLTALCTALDRQPEEVRRAIAALIAEV